jgi:IS30 family transposase
MEDKAKIVSWQEEGVWATVIADRLGHHRSSIERLFAKARALPHNANPKRKKALDVLSPSPAVT